VVIFVINDIIYNICKGQSIKLITCIVSHLICFYVRTRLSDQNNNIAVIKKKKSDLFKFLNEHINVEKAIMSLALNMQLRRLMNA